MFALEWVLGQQGGSTGAIDMVAVRKADGTLTCTPFHVKMGRGAKRGENKIIKLRVNGELASFHMKLGMAGEAFFVERTQDHVHRRYVTSPPESPFHTNERRDFSFPPLSTQDANATASGSRKGSGTPRPFPAFNHEGDAPAPGAELDLDGLSQHGTRPRTQSANAAEIDAFQTTRDHSQARRRSSSVVEEPVMPLHVKSPAKRPSLVSEVGASETVETSNASWTWMWGAMPTAMDKNAEREEKRGSEAGNGTKAERRGSGRRGSRGSGSDGLAPLGMPAGAGHIDIVPGAWGKVDCLCCNNQTLMERGAFEICAVCNWEDDGQGDGSPNEVGGPNAVSLTEARRLYCMKKELTPTIREVVVAGEQFESTQSLPGCGWTFSLCGHILSEMPGAPEPLPTTQTELSVMMAAYTVVADSPPEQCDPVGTTVVPGQIANDPLLVVVKDNFLLTWNVAAEVMEVMGRGGDTSRPITEGDVRAAISVVYKTQGGLEQAVRRRAWLGQSTLEWTDQYPLRPLRRVSGTSGNSEALSRPDVLVVSPLLDSSPSKSEKESVDGSCSLTSVRTQGNRGADSGNELEGSIDNDDGSSSASPSHAIDVAPDATDPATPGSPGTPQILSVSAWKGMVSSGTGVELDDDASVASAAPASPASAASSRASQSGKSPSPIVLAGPSPLTATSINMDDLDGGASIVSMSTLGTHTSDAPYSHAKRGLLDEDTDQEFVSLQDISLEDISPEPARGEMYDSDTDSYTSLSLEDGESGPGGIRIKKYLYQKSLVPTQEQLQGLKLKDGANEVVFELEGCEPLHSQLFVWPETCKVVVTDIEGALAVTKAGVLGFFQSHSLHDGAKDMLKVIERNGYQILYMANIEGGGDTKQLVTQLSGAGLHLPAGPVFKSPDSLIRAFGTERTDIFKAAALRGVRSLFPANHNPFYAAFGTSPSDRAAFSRCEVPEGRIFIVNKKGELMSQNKAFKTSFQDLCVSVEQHFPDLNGTHNRTQDSFNNMQFWKVPLPTIDD